MKKEIFQKIFIYYFVTLLMLMGFNLLRVSANTDELTKATLHASHYRGSTSVKWGSNNFTIRYRKLSNMDWSTDINAAVSTWNSTVGSNLKVGNSVYEIRSESHGSSSWAGETYATYILVNDTVGTTTAKRRETVAHELGHALGLGHVACTSELMRSYGFRGYYSLYEGDINGYNVVW